ncbi:hypothetical protein GLP30_11010 [Photobacterium phosphoreum]|uniref:Uncharacterized protein n=1 Tax=Photobacterium phosphoreum TaxID=659 RepID=A0AAW4ZWE1_PHOPO|nr:MULTISPECIES: hypothetical protein [Photobacterium]MCD9491350.1 hypothetical protein [Photobacterium phosphoreum]MCD9497615.1 hypothetical protein [Photobacterium carnosum]MCD9502389.1 hypothetical protein [Photobacterium phosphoreum]MCD9525154.1 hypothetical protein [Photobacterium carnosum]MCF2190616.1 hypothetical protein [Photobacterium phosphoreum]
MHNNFIWLKVNESFPLIAMFLLACIASLLRAKHYSLISIVTGIIFSGFIAYAVNLLLTDITIIHITSNMRIVAVGIAAYLNRYIMDILDRLASKISDNPIKIAVELFKLWKK